MGKSPILSTAILVFVLLIALSSAANADVIRVYDNAKCFSIEETADLENRINTFRIKTKTDLCIFTTDDFLGNDPFSIAGIFYDSLCLGIGPNNNGVIIYIDTYSRVPAICTAGDMIYLLSGDALDKTFDAMYGYLSSGEYAKAMHEAIEKIDVVIDQYWSKWLEGTLITE